MGMASVLVNRATVVIKIIWPIEIFDNVELIMESLALI